ncbi:MAG: MFS transporter [Puniceicoccales bacterium]|jgi:LPLT family lysophospholipid transporter-like MFS transporter|nr:MFS transporter [Puniceicoccales bacterium]
MRESAGIAVATALPRKNYPLLLTGQFLGAFGDCAIFAIIIGPYTFQLNNGEITLEQQRTVTTVLAAPFFLANVLFAPVAGFLNDRYAKTCGLAWGNFIKLGGAALCASSLVWGGWVQGLGYFIVGLGACVYSPAKYGILPEVLPCEKLVRANGTVELLTLLATLGGAVFGSMLADAYRDGQAIISYGIVVGIYGTALVANMFMARTAENLQVRLGQSTPAFFRHIRDLACSPRLARMLLGTALFWFIGVTMRMHIQPWGQHTLHLKENREIALLIIVLAVGVMAGSVLAGFLHKVGDLRRVPLYGAAMAGIFVVTATIAPDSSWLSWQLTPFGLKLILPVVALVFMAGFFAGMFLIPLNAALQAESDPLKIGKTIATQNLFDNVGMCVASAYLLLANQAGISPGGVFLGLAICTIALCGVLTWGQRTA